MKILIILIVIVLTIFTVYAIANKIKNYKTISVVLFIILVAIISILTTNQRFTEKQHAKIINLFNRDKTIQCSEMNVNKKYFNFVSGTLVFMGKEKSDFQGQIIPLDECRLKDAPKNPK